MYPFDIRIASVYLHQNGRDRQGWVFMTTQALPREYLIMPEEAAALDGRASPEGVIL